MDHTFSNNHGRPGRPYQYGHSSAANAGPRRWSADEIARLMREHPEYRIDSDPFACQLIPMVLDDPDDLDAQELLTERIRELQLAFLGSGDVFWGNYPQPGGLVYPGDFLHVGQMPAGDAIGLVINQLPGNVGVLGPTRSGKTTLLAHVFCKNSLLLQSVCIVAFVKKPELRHVLTLPQVAGWMSVLRRDDLAISGLQKPSIQVPDDAWSNEFVRLMAQCYGRFSARRLLGNIVNDLMANHPAGVYPTLRQVAKVLDAFKPRWGSREAGYKESMSWVLRDLLTSTGNIWDYSSSDFLENIGQAPGLAIFELEDLPSEHFTFIATYVMRWIYFKRLHGGNGAL